MMNEEIRDIQIVIDNDSDIPLWLQLRNRIIFLITSGEYSYGDKLPTVRELAVILQIHYNTVGKVYHDLEKDGYISTKQGRGTFVDDGYKKYETSPKSPIDSLTDRYINQCLELGVIIEEIPSIVQQRIEATLSNQGKE